MNPNPRELLKGINLDGILTAVLSVVVTVILAGMGIVILMWLTGRI